MGFVKEFDNEKFQQIVHFIDIFFTKLKKIVTKQVLKCGKNSNIGFGITLQVSKIIQVKFANLFPSLLLSIILEAQY